MLSKADVDPNQPRQRPTRWRGTNQPNEQPTMIVLGTVAAAIVVGLAFGLLIDLAIVEAWNRWRK